MEQIGLTDTADPRWEKAYSLYLESFPLKEQRTRRQYELALKDLRFHADTFTDGRKFIGLLFYWRWDKFRFIEHFAIDPALRGEGYGARILGELIASEIETVTILEIDPPVDNISIRREKFYRRCGFVTNSYEHIHLSFQHPPAPHRLLLMSYPRPVTECEFAAFRRFTLGTILKYSDLLPEDIPAQ